MLRESIIHWLSSNGLPGELVVLIVSTLPIFELRGGIPVGLLLGLEWWRTYIMAVLGNLIPVVPILLLLEPVSYWMRRHLKATDQFFEWLFSRTRRKTEAGIRKYGIFFGLTLFVAIPLPVTGAWTGCVAAFLFGVKFKYSFPAIILGVLTASLVVSMATYGTATVIRLFG
ncbi:ligand-binding protein SH3 [Candidatus Poribacteria bacterium]|nr:ligand-binding protein SH3 [Candidatus Poribacteria bacterium]